MKKQLFLLLLLGTSFYYYNKKSTDNLITIFIFILFLVMFNFDAIMEHAGNVGAGVPNETIQILASMFNNQTIKATNLELTGNLTVDGKTILKGDTNINGDTNIKGDLDVDKVVNIKGAQRGSYNDLKKGMTIDSTTIAAPGVMHLYGNGTLHLLNKDGVVVNHAWATDPKLGSGNLSVTKNVIIPKFRSLVVGEVGISHARAGDLDRFISYKAKGDRDGKVLWNHNLGANWGFYPNEPWTDVYNQAGVQRVF